MISPSGSRTLCVVAAVVALCVSDAVGQAEVRNAGFEQGRVGEKPRNWHNPTEGYELVLTDQSVREGRLCAQLRSSGQPGAPFGNLLQTLDATPYRGKRIRLRAAVRVDPDAAGDRAQMWLRVDRAGRKLGFFDNMGDRPIRTNKWAHYDIAGDIAADAVTITFGFMLIRKGTLWVDDVSVETVGDAAVVQGPAKLTDRGLENVMAFTRILGYVRHFHPSDAAANTNWDAFAVEGVRKIESAVDAADLAQRLEAQFKPIAPSVHVFVTIKKPSAKIKRPKNRKGLHTLAWEHRGFGHQKENSVYRSQRVREKSGFLNRLKGAKDRVGFPDPKSPYFAGLGGGVSCLVPLAVYADAKGTLPRPSVTPEESVSVSRRRYTGDDRATRLAAVALAWNVFQHFYPYFDVVGTDWDSVLPRALAAAATDKGERPFLDTLRNMVAQLKDGHGSVYHHSDRARATLPLNWDYVEGRLVITYVDKSALPLHFSSNVARGDLVLSVGGKPVGEALASIERLVSGATPQWIRYSGLRRLRMGEFGSKTEIVVQSPGKDTTRPVQITNVLTDEPFAEPRPEKVSQVRPGVWYVDIGRITDADFKAAVADLAKARGIVFDLRGYPNKLSTIVLGHLTDKPVTCAQWHTPRVMVPDRMGMKFDVSNWKVQPRKPRLKAKTAFIIDGRAISYAETYMGIVEHYRLAEIVGAPTAGTNGNVNPFQVPGGYTIVWTGMKVLKQDGSRHHGVGIEPTVPVKRTLAGVRGGRDEFLARAIEVVTGGK